MIRRTALLSLLLASLAACGGEGDDDVQGLKCDEETRADMFEAGMVKSGANGLFDVALLEAMPAPPDKGDNLWLVEVRDATSGAPVADTTLKVTPFMPDHGHGTAIQTVVTPLGEPGQLELDRINLWMPGLWEVRIKVTKDTDEDNVVFAFCIEG